MLLVESDRPKIALCDNYFCYSTMSRALQLVLGCLQQCGANAGAQTTRINVKLLKDAVSRHCQSKNVAASHLLTCCDQHIG